MHKLTILPLIQAIRSLPQKEKRTSSRSHDKKRSDVPAEHSRRGRRDTGDSSAADTTVPDSDSFQLSESEILSSDEADSFSSRLTSPGQGRRRDRPERSPPLTRNAEPDNSVFKRGSDGRERRRDQDIPKRRDKSADRQVHRVGDPPRQRNNKEGKDKWRDQTRGNRSAGADAKNRDRGRSKSDNLSPPSSQKITHTSPPIHVNADLDQPKTTPQQSAPVTPACLPLSLSLVHPSVRDKLQDLWVSDALLSANAVRAIVPAHHLSCIAAVIHGTETSFLETSIHTCVTVTITMATTMMTTTTTADY